MAPLAGGLLSHAIDQDAAQQAVGAASEMATMVMNETSSFLSRAMEVVATGEQLPVSFMHQAGQTGTTTSRVVEQALRTHDMMTRTYTHFDTLANGHVTYSSVDHEVSASTYAASSFMDMEPSNNEVWDIKKMEANGERVNDRLRDDVDVDPVVRFIKVMWFLLLFVPIVIAFFISLFYIGCPRCCCLCCEKSGCKCVRMEEDTKLQSFHPGKDGMNAYKTQRIVPGSSIQEEGSADEEGTDAGNSEGTIDGDNAGPTVDGEGESGTFLASVPSLSPTQTDVPMKSKSARIMVEPIPAPAPSSLRYRGAGGPSQYLSSLQQSEEYEEALEKELEKDQLLEVYYEGGGCCNGRLKIRRIGGCRCLSYNVVLWLLLIMVLCCVEFLYWKYFVYDPRYKVDTETRVVIISSAGGSGHLVAEKEIIKKMKSAAGWVPFAKATPGQLERLRNMPDKSFQSLYVVPKACETYDPKHKVWMPEGCYKRSWIQINDLISGVLEMMFDKVLTDFGRQGTEQWDEAQKTGDYDFLFQAIQLKDTVAEMLFSWGFRENTKAYLKTHPNVEFVVSVQAQLTNNIYQGVEIINRKREKQAYKKYLKTGNPADKKFSGVHFCLSLTDPPSQNNFFIRGLKQIQAHSGPRDKEHFIHIDMPHAGQAFMGLGHPQYPQNLLSSPQVQAGGQVAANAVMKDKALIDKAMAEAENEEYQFIDRRTPANVAYYKGMFNNRMIKTFRFTDGPIRTEFQKAVDDYYYKYPDGVPSRNAALVLPNIKNVNMNKEAQRIDIGADEHVAAVMLGGQAAVAATKHYVMGEAMRWVSVDANGNFDTTKSCQKVTIFAFCVKNEKLINEVMEISKTLGDQAKDGHRSRIRIFALGLQDSDVIAPIFQRAQNVYIRSGGMQIFEARSLVMGSKVTIHSDRPLIVTEKTRDGHPYKFCTRGMLSHEMGNAAWLLESLGQAMLICTYDGNDRQCFEVQPSGERLEYEKFVQTEADSAFYDPVEKKYKWASCIYVPGKHLAAKNMKAHKPEVTRCPP